MTYIQKYYKELFNNLLTEANDVELISHNELFPTYINSKQDISSFYVMTLSILADNIEDVYYDMTEVYESNKVEYALGTDLDDIGLIIGCPRPLAKKSCVELTFTLSTTYDRTIELPSNIIVSTHNGIQYETVEEAPVIPSGESEVKVYALSTEAGSSYRVGADTLVALETEIIDKDTGEQIGLRVTNEKPSSGGREAFDDEEYRTLLMDWVKNNTKGSKEAYERYFANVDGLESYKLLPNWNGVTGTLKIVLEPGYPYQLKQCYDEIVQDVCQFTEDIVMASPKPVPINIYVKCNVDIDEINPYSDTEKEEIKSRIIDVIYAFIDGNIYNYNGLSIGEDYIPYKLGVFISENVPEVKNVAFKDSTPISINNEELGFVNEVTVEITDDVSFDNKRKVTVEITDDDVYEETDSNGKIIRLADYYI